MINRLSIAAAALLPIASCTPPVPGGGSLTAGSAPISSPAELPTSFGGLPGGWFARQVALIANPTLVPPPQPIAQPLLPSAAQPFVNGAKTLEDSQRALDCLTAAVYYEARSESVEGQRAVAQVVLNRVRNPAFPASVCGVVYQGSERSTGCQFTFTCDGSMNAPRNEEAWERSKLVARAALAGDTVPEVGLATNYHADYVMPWWASGLDRIAQLGRHIFYRWKGALGNAFSFTQQYSGSEPEPTPGGSGLIGNPGLVRIAVGNGATVSIHRGNALNFSSSQGSAPAGVRVHRGTISALADQADQQSQPASQIASKSEGSSPVRIHRGSSLSEAEVDPT